MSGDLGPVKLDTSPLSSLGDYGYPTSYVAGMQDSFDSYDGYSPYNTGMYVCVCDLESSGVLGRSVPHVAEVIWTSHGSVETTFRPDCADLLQNPWL